MWQCAVCVQSPCCNGRPRRYDDTVRTLIFTGRPLRVLKTPYITAWEDRQQEIRQLCADGTIPFMKDVEEKGSELMKQRPLLMGQVCGSAELRASNNPSPGCGRHPGHKASAGNCG